MWILQQMILYKALPCSYCLQSSEMATQRLSHSQLTKPLKHVIVQTQEVYMVTGHQGAISHSKPAAL